MSRKNVPHDTNGQPDSGPTFIVGIGASAGGVEALTQFFEQVSADSGLAYVVILHLSPDYDSQLAEILQRVVPIPVTQVTKTVRIEANHVYVIPPNKQLQMKDGSIIVRSPTRLEERRAPVDIFLRTLAESHGPLAIAVILSGTGANGSMGLKRVKERGGAVFVQNPREAAFNEMPRHAIATDLVDDILPVAQIPARLLTYRQGLGTVSIPEDAPQSPEEQQALREVFTQLRLRTGHDFSNYKRSTLLRRIERRISIHNLPTLPAYAAFLHEHVEETQALLKDLLISVTNFFRDGPAFSHLEQQILPGLIRRGRETLRIWVAGCATGEEAYSLAMLCAEQTMGVIDAPKVQIFATDIDEDAIATAREGLYTLNDAADVSAERLSHFFGKEGEAYRLRREIREMILFAHHNVLKDPPFSKLDLVTCRNLLIYFNHVAQERVMETFHFALNPGGYLLLGLSETVDGSGDLYATLSREHHLYQSRQVAARPYPVPESIPQLPQLRKPPSEPGQEPESRALPRLSFGDLHQQILEQYAPPSIIVNEDYDILHVTPLAGRYLHVAGGELSKNILKLIRPELRLELRTALYQASQQQTNVDVRNLRIRLEESAETLTLHIRPVLGKGDPARGFILVLFERTGDGANEPSPVLNSVEPIATQLEDELIRVKAQLRSANEHHELQAEELKATNEELQAMNEELRSAAEELETGKEELQSINEELTTVNQELKVKVEEASLVGNNLQNLINSTDIATLFLDRSLRVNLFTPATRQLFNLITADFGRPLTDITNRLTYEHLQADAEAVLSRLQPVEREVMTTDGRVFIMRILPYRTADDRINGVVLTFVDITGRKAAEVARRESEEKYRRLFDSIDEAFCTIEVLFDGQEKAVDYRFLETNPAFLRQTGLKNVIGQRALDFVPDLEPFWFDTYGRVAKTGEAIRFEHLAAAMNRYYDVYAFRFGEPEENHVAVVFNDISDRKRQEANLVFLADVSQDLVGLTNIDETMNALGAKIGGHFRAPSCAFFEFNEAGDEAMCKYHWHRADVPTFVGIYRTEDFYTDEFLQTMRAREAFVLRDRDADSRVDAKSLITLNIVSLINIPIVTDGQLQFVLCINDTVPRNWHDDEIDLMRELTDRIWTRLERARAEEALAKSEQKYRTLFDSMDEGVMTLELIFDEADQAIDFRYLEHNPALTRQTGLTQDIIGPRVSEMFPDLEAYWLQSYERVVKTGEPERHEYYFVTLDKWFDIYISRASGEVSRAVICVYNNITERKRTEERQAFLLQLSDALRPLTGPIEVQNEAMHVLGEHLGANRAVFWEAEPDGEHFVTKGGYAKGVEPITGRARLNDFGVYVKQSLTAGQTFVVTNVATDPRVSATELAAYGAIDVGAFIAAPLVKGDQLVVAVGLYRAEAHDWTTQEIVIVEETAERTWAIVERARVEAALRESEQRLASIRSLTLLGQTEELAEIGSWEFHPPICQFAWSAGMYRLFELPPHQSVQPDIYLDFVVDQDRNQAQRLVSYLYEGEGHLETSFRIRVGDQVKTLRIKADVLGEGDQKRVLGVDLDITEQLKAQHQIRETAENLQAVLNASPASIALLKAVHEEGHPEHIRDFCLAVGNDKLAQFLGQPLSELLGQSAVGYLGQLLWDGATLEVLRQVYHSHESRYDEKRLPAPKQDRWLALSVIRQDDGVVLTGLDITELKQVQAQQQGWLSELEASRHSVEALTTLRASLSQRTELLRSVSHDLRGNFGVITGALSLLEMADSEGERAQMMEMVLRNVKQATGLLTDLLDLARLETGQQQRVVASFDAGLLLTELGQSLRPMADEQTLELVLSGPDTLLVENDRQLVYRMAQNLIINALKYTHQGRVTVQWGDDEDRWWFEVFDTGPGLAQEVVAQLNSNELIRSDVIRSHVTSQRGEGIGLRIVRELAHLLEAHVQVSSETGVGTRFTVRFPLRYVDA